MLIMEKIFSEKIKRTKGKDVWQENFHLAIFAADKVISTFGPKGAFKLVYNKGPEQVVTVTEDAITTGRFGYSIASLDYSF